MFRARGEAGKNRNREIIPKSPRPARINRFRARVKGASPLKINCSQNRMLNIKKIQVIATALCSFSTYDDTPRIRKNRENPEIAAIFSIRRKLDNCISS